MSKELPKGFSISGKPLSLTKPLSGVKLLAVQYLDKLPFGNLVTLHELTYGISSSPKSLEDICHYEAFAIRRCKDPHSSRHLYGSARTITALKKKLQEGV